LRFSPEERQRIETDFSRHINAGQVRYLKAGHLDVIECEREGIRFSDASSGRPMIDAFSSAGSFNVGRHNPDVLAALEQALDDGLDLGTHHLPSPAKLALARKLVDVAPGDLNHVLFASGGGDAVDGAIKLARGATGRPGVVATVKAYHGHTGFALSANGKEHYRRYFEPLMPGFEFAAFNDLAAMRHAVSERTAAIIIEPIQGEAGIFVGDEEYLRGLRTLCDELGIVLIFDEIQTGFARTGRMFACEHTGVVPDVMTVAKSLGGGLYANAAILYRDVAVLADYVDSNPRFHPTSCGGSDLGCRASLAAIDFIERERLWENAERQGARLKDALLALMRDNPKIIKEVRGLGLMVGLEYLHEFMGPMMSDALARHSVFAAYSGNAPQVMRFMVPLTVSDAEMDRLIDSIRAAVGEMKRLLPLALPAARIPAVRRLLNSEQVQTGLFGMIRKAEDAVARLRGRRRP